MNNVFVFKKVISANFDGFFMGDVKSESMYKPPMKLLGSAAKLNESLTAYLLVVNGSKVGTKTLLTCM